MSEREIIGNNSIPVAEKITAVRERFPAELRSPVMAKRVIISPPHQERFNPDGTPNHQVHLRGSGATYDAATGLAVVMFEGIRPVYKNPPHGFRQRSAVFAAMSTDNWQTVQFFDPTNPDISDRTTAQPVVESIAPPAFSLHGQQDPRITLFSPGTELETHVIVANTSNIVAKMRGLDAIERDLDRVLGGGAAPEVYLARDITDPATYRSFGVVGPEEHFKNIVLHPQPVMRGDEQHVLFFGRRFPDIQAFTIPLADIGRFLASPTYRKKYWAEHLTPEALAENTVMQPIFDWEAVDESRGIKGQIAGGASPVEVTYTDPRTEQRKNAWLFVYNSTTAFNERNDGIGRVVGAALLDHEDPAKVIARAPMPIIWPTQGKEVEGGIYKDVTFATGAYVDRDNTLRVMYTAGDSEVSMASCPADEMVGYLAKFDAAGNPITK